MMRPHSEDTIVPPKPLQLPREPKGLRACRRCRRILTEIQFIHESCANCRDSEDPVPSTRQEVEESTVHNFSGYIGLINPERSWVARLMGSRNVRQGIYAFELDDVSAPRDTDVSIRGVSEGTGGGDGYLDDEFGLDEYDEGEESDVGDTERAVVDAAARDTDAKRRRVERASSEEVIHRDGDTNSNVINEYSGLLDGL
eukprot:Tbor_TRINITY_DN3508_c0_g1::TRINITY_DN3508_c0_g1_i1::g.2923::m.2923/K15171/SUPT4H1, SPT4; transcription elongation factor SPT4